MLQAAAEYISQVILPKIEQRQGWARFYAETDVLALLPGAYVIGDEVLRDEEFRDELLKIFSQDHMLDLFPEVKFLPPSRQLGEGWTLDVTPSELCLEVMQ